MITRKIKIDKNDPPLPNLKYTQKVLEYDPDNPEPDPECYTPYYPSPATQFMWHLTSKPCVARVSINGKSVFDRNESPSDATGLEGKGYEVVYQWKDVVRKKEKWVVWRYDFRDVDTSKLYRYCRCGKCIGGWLFSMCGFAKGKRCLMTTEKPSRCLMIDTLDFKYYVESGDRARQVRTVLTVLLAGVLMFLFMYKFLVWFVAE